MKKVVVLDQQRPVIPNRWSYDSVSRFLSLFQLIKLLTANMFQLIKLLTANMFQLIKLTANMFQLLKLLTANIYL